MVFKNKLANYTTLLRSSRQMFVPSEHIYVLISRHLNNYYKPNVEVSCVSRRCLVECQ